ncbi:Spo12 family protein [Aspergillus puulaauensis]|uniref:Spo12 family-domain-containing protein n=1 Tax=Aspergillus puulaauensis TaxID=1220207 RepID=A0A7R7XEV3_9EURO|nr:uncharacterized protein APUU_20584A [Aspergillus puulaauensis]BCS20152.1 hypothetical protein APUU_20584A [Aspergillus puulaauensis]
MSSTPLAARSPNTHLASSNNEQDLKTASTTMNSMDHHRQILQGKLDSQEKQQTYVSPSDDIMSPCSKKLSDIKGKRFKNAGKPQSLFAKLGKKNYEQSSAEKARNSTDSAEKSA